MEGFAVLNVRRTLLVLSRSFMRRDSSHRPITRHFSAPALTWKSWTAWCFQCLFYTYISDINSRCTVGSQYWPVHVYTSFSLITEFLIFDKLLHGCVSFYCTTSLEMWKLDRVFLISSLQSQFFFFFFLYTMYMKLWFRRFYLLQMPVLWIRNGVRLGYMMKNTCKTDPLLHKRFTELLHAVLRGHDRLSNFIRKRKFVDYIVY